MWETFRDILGIQGNYNVNGTMRMAKKEVVTEATPAVKKRASRSALPKAARKSSTSTSSQKKDLLHAEGEYRFYFSSGHVISNLLELLRVLEEIDDAQFSYHVTAERNDFVPWVGIVLCDDACAKKIKRAKTRQATIDAVRTSLSTYNV
jgi:hypothetical protein